MMEKGKNKMQDIHEGCFERVMKDLGSSIPDPFFLTDEDGKILILNQKARDKFGIHCRIQDIGKSIREFVIWADCAGKLLNAPDCDCLRNGHQTYGLDENGEKFPIKLYVNNFELEGFKIFSVIMRENREEISAIRLQETLGSINDIIIQFDRKGEILFSNKLFEEVFGIENESSIKNVSEILASDSKLKWEQILSKDQKEGFNQEFEESFIANNGKEIIINGNITFHKDSYGEPYYLGIFKNVTLLRSQKSALERDKRKLESVMENTVDSMIVIDADGIIKYVNKSTTLLFGYPPDEMLGKNVKLLMPIEHARQHDTYINNNIETGNNKVIGIGREVMAKKKDGTEFPIHLAVGVTNSENGKPVEFVGTIHDMTKEKERQVKLEQATKNSERARASQSTFLANMSHEIRTPLNGILGILNILDCDSLSPQQLELISIMKSSGEVLSDLVEGVLNFSKIEAGKIELENIDFDFYDLIESIKKIFSPKIKEKGLSFNIFLDEENIPHCLIGDSLRLKQILINLINNALKFTSRGTVELKIECVDGDDEYVELLFLIEDTGTGIPKEKIGKIFQPFEQVDSSVHRIYGGTGLGLKIVQNFVKLMGGEVNIHSKVGKGSTFYFKIKFPRSNKSKNEIGKLGSEFLDIYVEKEQGILIVEDNSTNQLVIRAHLEQVGFKNIYLAENGLEALNIIKEKKGKIDLIFMDYNMPIMDGFKTTEHLRENGFLKPIVALTASAFKGDKEKGLEYGMDDYLSKPFRENQLYGILKKWLNIKEFGKLETELDIEKAKGEKIILVGVDKEKISFLRKLFKGNEEDYIEILNKTINIEEEINLFFTNLGNNNFEEIGKLAHKLKGQFAQFGAGTFTEKLITLEKLVKNNPNIISIRKLIIELMDIYFSNVKPFIEEELFHVEKLVKNAYN